MNRSYVNRPAENGNSVSNLLQFEKSTSKGKGWNKTETESVRAVNQRNHQNTGETGDLLTQAKRLGYPVEKLDTARSVEYLDKYGKDMILAANMARWNPTKFAEDFLDPMLKLFNTEKGPLTREIVNKEFITKSGQKINVPTSIMTKEGKAAVEDAIDYMKALPGMDPLQPNTKLSSVAQGHADDLNKAGHTSGDGTTFEDRMKRNNVRGGTGENFVPLAEGMNPLDAVISLLVDDGVPSRGHRLNILNPEYKTIGIGHRKTEGKETTKLKGTKTKTVNGKTTTEDYEIEASRDVVKDEAVQNFSTSSNP